MTALATSFPDPADPVNTSPYWSTNCVPPPTPKIHDGAYCTPMSRLTLSPAPTAALIWACRAPVAAAENWPCDGSMVDQSVLITTSL